jgi:hypothetical protein
MKISDSTLISSIQMADQSAPPAAPVPGMKRLFVMSDGIYIIDEYNNVTGPLSIGGASGPATQIIEQSGPTQLDIVGLADQEFLMRDGNTIASRNIGNSLNGTFWRNDYALIREEQPSGMAGSVEITSGDWVEVAFNSELVDTAAILTLNGNRFILQPGEYTYQISVSGNGNNHVARLYSITDDAPTPICEGMPVGGQTPSVIQGIMRIDVETEFCVQQYSMGPGFVGIPLGAGITEIYSVAQFWRRSL